MSFFKLAGAEVVAKRAIGVARKSAAVAEPLRKKPQTRARANSHTAVSSFAAAHEPDEAQFARF